jgi:glycosyltransferase involved in cell wall biosynthesis
MKYLPDNINLTIIGDGPLEAELQSLAQKNGLWGRITFMGYKSRTEIYRHLQEADCFVLSSLHEGLGIVVQEAMYAGLPVIATNSGGQTDLIQVPRNGILVPPKDVKTLVGAISVFYTNRQFAQSVGKANQEDLQKHYIATNSEEYVTLFHELINTQRLERKRSVVPPSYQT